MRRVVITGMGMVSPVGNDVPTSWDAAINGRTGTDRITLFDTSDLPVKIAAEVKGFDGSTALDPKEIKRVFRFGQFARVAAKEALNGSGLDLSGDNRRYGASIGVGMGALYEIEKNTVKLADQGARRISPFFIPYAIVNMAAGDVSLRHGLRGPNLCTATACASGSHAIGEALLYIRNDMADVMVCGGAESTISPLGIAAFAALKALSKEEENPATASRPFDLDRNGFIMGEGAGLMVLEELEHARKRGAPIIAEVVGYGLSGDAHHITAPPPGGEGGQQSMIMAMDSAGCARDDVDYINAHGTSTKLNDKYETQAIRAVFESHADSLAVSSTKGVTGHCIGAGGGIEAIFTALAVQKGIQPPTANLTTPDPECDLDYIPGEAREKPVRVALSNSFGFGGTNATLALKRFDG